MNTRSSQGYLTFPQGPSLLGVPQAPQGPRRPHPEPKAKPGGLYIRDSFIPSIPGLGAPPETPHGRLVIKSAKDTKFQGEIVPSIANPPTPSGDASRPHMQKLGQKPMTREEARKTIAESLEAQVTSFLDDQSSYLETVTKSGAKNTAANFSLGQSKASLVQGLYQRVLTSALSEQGSGHAAHVFGEGPHSRDNFIKAFNIDVDKLKSKDPKIRGAEEKRLQQAIIDHVSNTVDKSKKIDKSINRWDDAVEAFESNNNSVIISAGNEGDIEEQLEESNGGGQLKLPKDFEANLLENDLVTSVGATTTDKNGNQKRAEWSSESGGVDVYADGTVQDPHNPSGKKEEGTSFAAPRIAALMAELHKRFPHLSSKQIENMLIQRLTKGGKRPTVAAGVDLDALKSKTY